MLLPWGAFAEVTVDASAISRYEFNSNVFDLQTGFPVPGTTDFQRSDTLYTYGAALDVNYLFAQQKLFISLSTTNFHYDHFTVLDHNEYKLDGGWNWRLGHAVDGTIEVLRDRTMVPFTSVENVQFVIQTEQRETATVGVAISPDWRIEGSGHHDTLDQVIYNSPNIDLTESFGQVALKYLGIAGLSSGLSGGYTVGNFTGTGAVSNPSYRQKDLGLVATYKPTGRSIFNGSIGYSDRTSGSAQNSISGVTGKIDYTDQLTAKTSLDVQLSRLIDSYVQALGSEFDTIAALRVQWQATYKLGVAIGYNWTDRNLPDQGNAPIGGDRVDHLQYASINVDYEATRWLSIKPYANLQTRTSNFVGGNFNATMYGVYFTVKWQNHPQQINYSQAPLQPQT
jgi:hypothetical protein